jgi:hypothetical protein
MNNTNDMDIDNYTNEELLDIVNLNDNSTLYDRHIDIIVWLIYLFIRLFIFWGK